jgi:peptidoglycan/xylan/chitin deacetylase (PgdA/CDA1 family)
VPAPSDGRAPQWSSCAAEARELAGPRALVSFLRFATETLTRLGKGRFDVETFPVTGLVTLDFDAETIWKQRARGGDYMGVSYESQGTYGAKVGVWRILDLLAAREIRATFFVPGWVAERYGSVIESILQAGHEVALHGFLHENPARFVDVDEEEMVLVRGIKALTDVTGQAARGYRPPAYVYTSDTREMLVRYGFLYGSAMSDDDQGYVHQGLTGLLAELPVKWHLADDQFGWHKEVGHTPSQVEEQWTTELAGLRAYSDRIYLLTLHPQIIGHPGRLPMLDRVLRTAIESNVVFRRCDEYAADLVAKER